MLVRSYRMGADSLAIISRIRKAYPVYNSSDVVREALKRMEAAMRDDIAMTIERRDHDQAALKKAKRHLASARKRKGRK